MVHFKCDIKVMQGCGAVSVGCAGGLRGPHWVEDGQGQLDKAKVARALLETQATRGAARALVADAQARVQDALGRGCALRHLQVQWRHVRRRFGCTSAAETCQSDYGNRKKTRRA